MNTKNRSLPAMFKQEEPIMNKNSNPEGFVLMWLNVKMCFTCGLPVICF